MDNILNIPTIYIIYGLSSLLFIVLLIFSYVIYKKNIYIDKLKEHLLQSTQNISKLEALSQSKDEKLQELKEEYQKKEEIVSYLQNEKSKLHSTVATLKTTLFEEQKRMSEKMELLQKSKEEMKKEFEILAQKALENNSRKFEERSVDRVNEVLKPVKMQIEEFRKRVDDIYEKESKDRFALINEIKTLKELNEKMSKEAINLTNALKGESKSQGIWGEMILQKVLESSGLREGYEYEREVSLKAEEGTRYRPDVIVKLPGNREIIIDAKTSLRDYERYIACENDDEKKVYLKRHIESIKEHIKELSRKDYEKLLGINSLDFVFMFVPIEGALMLALENDSSLYDEAFKKHIVLVSPTTLLVALRAVENSWRYEKQAQNIKEVTNRAEKLYGKFVGFVKDLENVGKSLKKAQESYDLAFGKLATGRGNIITQIEQFKKLSNISPKQQLPKELTDNIEEDLNDNL